MTTKAVADKIEKSEIKNDDKIIKNNTNDDHQGGARRRKSRKKGTKFTVFLNTVFLFDYKKLKRTSLTKKENLQKAANTNHKQTKMTQEPTKMHFLHCLHDP